MTDFDAFTLPFFLKILALKRGETLFPSEGQAGPWRSWRAEDGLHCFFIMHRLCDAQTTCCFRTTRVSHGPRSFV